MPAAALGRRQVIQLDGRKFVYQHAYRMGRVTYVVRLPLTKQVAVWIPGHLEPDEIAASLRGENAFMLR